MKAGFIVSAGDPREAAELAAAAEAAGWDGVFTWDGVAIGTGDTYDPWVVMAAMAMRTERVTLGAIVTPPSRRRPWKLAREALSVDVLSGGRLVLPVGLGALDDAAFGAVGEATDARTRAELLDETLAILEGLWSGEPFAFEGAHYRFPALTFRPTPVQRPRVPIWVVAVPTSDRSMARAARWDGLVSQVGEAAELAPITTWLDRERPSWRTDGFELVAQGSTQPDQAAAAAIVRPWAEAGATWWLDADWSTATVESQRRRIEVGPPQP
ncbi:MAG TPA: LLM class flavin-dependent oxidoreductase [Candidatus Limnocylindrales bacterium]|nr:LLM class flavin-dependent oxidoreductase [Candidatus Limnocylindrales bacterium]